MSNKLLRNFLIQLKNAALINNTYVDVFITKDIQSFILIFYKKGFIISYLQITYKKVRIFLNYFKFQSLFSNMEIYLKKYSKFELMQFFYGHRHFSNSLYFIKTVEGICTLEELLLQKRFKIGFLVCRIQY